MHVPKELGTAGLGTLEIGSDGPVPEDRILRDEILRDWPQVAPCAITLTPRTLCGSVDFSGLSRALRSQSKVYRRQAACARCPRRSPLAFVG